MRRLDRQELREWPPRSRCALVRGGCPVCGSEQHPAPARGRVGAPTPTPSGRRANGWTTPRTPDASLGERVHDLTVRDRWPSCLSGYAGPAWRSGSPGRRRTSPGGGLAINEPRIVARRATSRRGPTRSPGAGYRAAASTPIVAAERRRGPSSRPSRPCPGRLLRDDKAPDLATRAARLARLAAAAPGALLAGGANGPRRGGSGAETTQHEALMRCKRPAWPRRRGPRAATPPRRQARLPRAIEELDTARLARSRRSR